MPNAAILCVDDEVVILKSLEIELQEAFASNYLYEFAESADEALEIIDEFDEEDVRILIIVSDWLMPGIKGDEFLIQVHQKFPKIIKVMLTGQADEEAIERAEQHANLYRCLHKPWNREELIQTIQSALAQL
ncbi:response regulator [Lusitaniella coriacea LEGE 07157]|uniref:Response regulator n=1 Tax=Lusitaniella coriacea LEGE 07157 TaxID=945747 RepID=A0A8J7DV11_9CYAN|nr:response regulator [Lusitaniella coriacea]MBE9115507.1 response regulator [Lusitaniella coriacea LEGE 07157]